MEQLKVTSLEQLKEISKGDLVALPPFSENQPFVARLKRPSLLSLASTGKIPNILMEKANQLFTSSAVNTEDGDMLKDMFGVLELLASETLMEPTYKQIKDAGVSLTDEQLMFLFNYSQIGVKALENFRTVSKN